MQINVASVRIITYGRERTKYENDNAVESVALHVNFKCSEAQRIE